MIRHNDKSRRDRVDGFLLHVGVFGVRQRQRRRRRRRSVHASVDFVARARTFPAATFRAAPRSNRV